MAQSANAATIWEIALLPAEVELDEEGTRISLTIVDTPGFGDQIDNEARYNPGFLLPIFFFLTFCAKISTASRRLSDTSSANMMIS
jgi:Septin